MEIVDDSDRHEAEAFVEAFWREFASDEPIPGR